MNIDELKHRLISLIAQDPALAYVLDYALNANYPAFSDGNFNIQQELVPNFKDKLDCLKQENIVEDYKGTRYTGETQSFRIKGLSNDDIKIILTDFYNRLNSDAPSVIKEFVEKYPLDISHILEEIEINTKISFDRKERKDEEIICKEFVRKGLMFSWNWITKSHKYNCYNFRQSPFNALGIFTNIVTEKFEDIFNLKIDEYLENKNASRLNYLLAHYKYGHSSEREDELRKAGWSEKAIAGTSYALNREKMLLNEFSKFFPKFREVLLNKKDEINELNIGSNQELNKLNLSLTSKGFFKRKEYISIDDIIELIENYINKLRDEGVELLEISKRENRVEAKFICNKQLYRLEVSDAYSYSCPTPSYDKEILIWNKIPQECLNGFLSKKEVRGRLFIIGYKDLSFLAFDEDPIVNFLIEILRSNDMPITIPISKMLNYYENIRMPVVINEEFVYIEPFDPKAIEGKILVLFEQAQDNVLILNPYPDKNTFYYLKRIKPSAKIQLVIKDEKDLKNKFKIEKTSADLVEKTIGDKNIQVKSNKFLHSRLIIIDNKKVFLSSFDVQEKGMEERYQYAFLTDNKKIIDDTLKYFKTIWDSSESQTVNLKEEFKKSD